MTLPLSPNSISMGQVNTELGLASSAQISLNDSAVRALFQINSGTISLSDGWGKSATAALNSPSVSAIGLDLAVRFTITNPNGVAVIAYHTYGSTNINPNSSATIDRATSTYGETKSISVYLKAVGKTDSATVTTSGTSYSRLSSVSFTSSIGGTGTFTFVWGAVTNATNYNVTFNGVTTNQTGTAFSKSSVSPGSYSISVVAKGSGYSDSPAATSPSVTVTLPDSLSISYSNVTNAGATANISYSGSHTIATYYVYVYSNAAHTALVTSVSGAASSLNITGLNANTSYYTSVEVQFSGGGGMSINSSFTTAAPVFTSVSQNVNVTPGYVFVYNYTTPVTRTYTFKSENPTLIADTVMDIYQGTTLLGSNDDSAGNAINLGSYLQLSLAANTTIQVRVRLLDPAKSGSFVFTIT